MISSSLLLGAAPSIAGYNQEPYVKVGNWQTSVISDKGRFLFCAAETDNGRVSLRIQTDGRHWRVGAPYYDNGPVMGTIGFHQLNDAMQFQTLGETWATTEVPEGLLNSLRNENQFMMELDRGVQVWSLKGSSAAIGKLIECAANRGAHPATNQRAQTANQPDHQGERVYGQVRGWTVKTGYDDKGIVYCSAEVHRENGALRIMSNSREWLMGVPYQGTQTQNGEIILDGSRGGTEFFSNGSGWAVTQIAPSFAEDIANGNTLEIENGRASHVIPLSGSAAALLKLKECLQTGGNPTPTQVQLPDAQPQEQPALVFSGSWNWKNTARNNHQSGNSSKLEMLENNRFNYCYNATCTVVTGQYGPDDSMSFSTDGKNYFEFMFPEPGEAEGRFWLDFNGPARAPDATITMYD